LVTPSIISKNLDHSNKSYKCPFASISNEDCSWIGSLQDMKSHIKTSHSNGNDTHECDGRFNVVLTNLSPEHHYRKAVWTADELFYVVWEITDDSFFCAVLYVGQKKKSSKFVYKFSLSTENGIKMISMCFRTRSVVQEMEKILTHGDCVVLHYDTVLKFLNSDKCLSCDFEIRPIETTSDIDKNQSNSEPSKIADRDPGHFTVKAEFLGEQTSPMKREFLDERDDIHRGAHRGGRRGRGCGPGRSGRAGRRGARDTSVGPHSYRESGVGDFQHRGNIGKHSNMGRSLTDLRDGAHYQDRQISTVAKLRNTVNAISLKVKSSLPTGKGVSSDQVTGVSAMVISHNKFQVNDSKIISSSSLPPANRVSVYQLTKVPVSRKSQDKFQAKAHEVNSSSSLPTGKGVPSDECTNVLELDKSEDRVQPIYPKLNSSYESLVNDYQGTYVSPFDTLHDIVKANNPKVGSNISVARHAYSDKSTNLSPKVFPADNGPDTSTSSEETWKCFVCGLYAPKNQTNNFLLLDIAPPGTTWKCKLCCQWRA
jgi:hypothetical protein